MEEQNKNLEQEYTPAPHEEVIAPRNNWLLIISVIVLFLALAGGGVYWWLQQRTAPEVNDYQPVEDIEWIVEEEIFKPNIENDNSYVYGFIELSYKDKEENKLGYDLFIKSDNTEKLLADDILFDVLGGSVPKFYETEIPNVVLLKASMGDMGGYQHQYYYIDIDTEDILKIVETQSDIIFNNIKLTLDIEDECPVRKGLREYEGGTAFLDNILVNGVSKYVYSPRVQLNCIDPGGLGATYIPQPQIKFEKVSVDRTKVYFEILEETFYYDIDNKVISKNTTNVGCLPEQKNVDLCMEIYINEEYSFSLKFPESWQKNYYVTRYDKSVVFNLSKELEGLFHIVPYEKEQYQEEREAYQRGEQPSPGRYLGEDDNYIYGLVVSSDLYDKQHLVKEIQAIADTFEFIK